MPSQRLFSLCVGLASEAEVWPRRTRRPLDRGYTPAQANSNTTFVQRPRSCQRETPPDKWFARMNGDRVPERLGAPLMGRGVGGGGGRGEGGFPPNRRAGFPPKEGVWRLAHSGGA